MALHVCVLEIDGSGKSTITAALPGILAAEMSLQAGSAGEAFRFVGPDEDHLAPNFHPDGLPIPARVFLSGSSGRRSNRSTTAAYTQFSNSHK